MKRNFISLFLFVLLAVSSAHGGDVKEVTAEYKIKAALIYKLAMFVEWPPQAFEQSGSPLEICLLGENPFGNALAALEQRRVDGRPIRVIHRSNVIEDIKAGCHLLFISKTQRPGLRKLLNSLSGLPVLTISDMDSFAENGGIIQMASLSNRIGFKVNLGSARHAGLKLSSSLLYLSTVVESDEGEGD